VRNYNLDVQLERALNWVNKTLPNRSIPKTKAKLFEEMGELVGSDFKDPAEYADVLIVLDDLAEQHGIDLTDAVIAKMNINRNRDWSLRESGVYKHVDKHESFSRGVSIESPNDEKNQNDR